MRALRIGIVVAVVLVALVLVIGVGVPAAMSTPALKARVLAVTSRAAGREVGASRVRVAPFFTSVRLENFTLAQPPGFPAGHALEADRVSFDLGIRRLLRGEVVGALDGRGVRANIFRKGDRTSLDGLAGGEHKEGKPAGKEAGGVEVNLDVNLRDGRLVTKNLDTNETVTLDGVGLRTHLASASTAPMPVTLTIKSIERAPLTFRDVRIDAVEQGKVWNVQKLATNFPGGGTLTGNGRFNPTGGWKLALSADAVTLDENLRPVVAALFPVLAAPGGALAGRLDGSFDLQGDGLSWVQVRRSLRGSGKAALQGVEASPGTVIAKVAALAGLDANTARLQDTSAAFRIEDGWIRFDEMRARVGDAPIDLAGRVSLEGRLDLTSDIAPLVKRIKGGPFEKVAGSADKLPVGITGTVTSPRIAPPKPEQLTPEMRERAKDLLKGLFGK